MEGRKREPSGNDPEGGGLETSIATAPTQPTPESTVAPRPASGAPRSTSEETTSVKTTSSESTLRSGNGVRTVKRVQTVKTTTRTDSLHRSTTGNPPTGRF